ncbi:hypothetical protein ACLB1S_32635 [Escherichia coli]
MATHSVNLPKTELPTLNIQWELGRKRVFEVLKAAHDPLLRPNGLLLIDELDVLLHEKAFKKLIEELISIAEDALLEIISLNAQGIYCSVQASHQYCQYFQYGNRDSSFPWGVD